MLAREFGLPLVYVAVQADVQTNVAKPESGRTPFNQFDHHRESPAHVARPSSPPGPRAPGHHLLRNESRKAEPDIRGLSGTTGPSGTPPTE